MRILVTGSRTFDDAKTIHAALQTIADAAIRASIPMVTVVHGACPNGADELADQWVRWYRGDTLILAERHPALWSKYRNRAGIVRNEQMIATRPDLLLSFIRDDSPGATHCTELAMEAGIPVRLWRYGVEGVQAFDSRHLAGEDVMGA